MWPRELISGIMVKGIMGLNSRKGSGFGGGSDVISVLYMVVSLNKRPPIHTPNIDPQIL